MPVIREHYFNQNRLDLAGVGDGVDDTSLWPVELLIGTDYYLVACELMSLKRLLKRGY